MKIRRREKFASAGFDSSSAGFREVCVMLNGKISPCQGMGLKRI